MRRAGGGAWDPATHIWQFGYNGIMFDNVNTETPRPQFDTDPILEHYPDPVGTARGIVDLVSQGTASYDDCAVLAALAPHLAGDVTLLEPAGVPEAYQDFPVVYFLLDLLDSDVLTDAPEMAPAVERIRAMVTWLREKAVDGYGPL